jgi:cytochrome c55X
MSHDAIVALVALLAFASTGASAAGSGAERAPVPASAETGRTPEPVRQDELVHLLKQDCGSCHGMRLTGGLGPPLTAEALREKPGASLVATILSGRPGTAMPPWRRFISEPEAQWLVGRLQAGAIDVRR